MTEKNQKVICKIIQKVSKKKSQIYLHEPYLDINDELSLVNSIKSKNISTYGKTTKIFEEKLKKFTKAKYVVALNSGTSALQLSIIACGIKKYEEVLIPSLNFIASSNAVIYNNSIPHYIDCDYDLGINFNKLDSYLTKITRIKNNQCFNKKTGRIIKAIIPTHIFGRVSKIAKLKSICKKFKLILIEDASEAFGTFFKRRHAGTFGLCGAISFNGNKIITTGGGGAILTNSQKIYLKINFLASVSKKKTNHNSRYDEVGYNFKMPSINAALGISQLKKINYILIKKKQNYFEYKNLFKSNNLFEFIKKEKNISSNHWLNFLMFQKSSRLDNSFFNYFKKKKIEIRRIWSLTSEGKLYKKYPRMNLDNSRSMEQRIICIPSGVFK